MRPSPSPMKHSPTPSTGKLLIRAEALARNTLDPYSASKAYMNL